MSASPANSLRQSRLLLSINDLPTLPDRLAEVLRLANAPDATVHDLEDAVSSDQSLAARVLRVANSGLYGSRKIGTLNHAVRLLGLREIQNISASMALSPQFRMPASSLVDGPQLWQHALATALWTRLVAKKLRFLQTEHLFTAGLMHDIGLLVLAKVYPRRYNEALQPVLDRKCELIDAEDDAFTTNHARVGAMLCAKWMLPPQLTQLVSSHHSPSPPTGPAAQILQLADTLARHAGMAEFPWLDPPDNLNLPLLEASGLSESEFEDLLIQAPQIHTAVGELRGLAGDDGE